ncbi:MAG: DUF4374 domain-containing protein [Muribaculaceae bacterium]|nr:DUF4374 domain-containing protein [Muribaculaceae bacterium]
MTKKYFRGAMLAAMLPALALTACSDDKDEPIQNPDTPTPTPTVEAKYVFATTVQGSNGTTNVLLTGESLDEGTITTVGNGLQNDGATQWVFYRDYLYALTYNQGNAGATRSYILNADGEMEARNRTYKINRFSSYGAYDNDIITMSTGAGPEQFADANGYLPMTLLVTYLDVVNQSMRENNTTTGAYSMENFLGNGEYVTLSGAEQSGSKLYCGAVPMGLSQYGSAYEGGRWIKEGNESLVHTSDGGTGAGGYKAGELVGTQYPDECWVAIYDNEDMLNPKLAYTDKISTPCGRFRSQYYQTVWADDKGDIYVFSSSYAKTMSDTRQQTQHPAGVCRIKAGETEFDNSYYCNIEEQTPGGDRSFMRCWPAGGSCFIMVMYDRALTEANPAATELAIFNAETKKLTYVTGLPAGVSSIGKTVYAQNGKVYIPVNVENEYPAIYAIDTTTAVAVKGVTIEATDITGFGCLSPVE